MTRPVIRALVLGIPVLFAAMLPEWAAAGVDVWTRGAPLVVPVLSLAIDPASSTRVYAGTSRGLFRTIDGGNKWVSRLGPGTAGAVRAIAIDPSTPTTVYAAGEVTLVTSGNTGTVYKSTDSGTTWSPAGTGLPAFEPTIALAIDPVTPSILYAATLAGLFKTTDSGSTWTAAGTGLPSSVRALVIDPAAPSTVYAATPAGVFKTTTGGASWASASVGLAQRDVTALAIDPADTGALYAATSSRVFKTTNAAASWSNASTGLPATRMLALTIDPACTSTVYVGTLVGIFRSDDSGRSWTSVNDGLTSLGVRALAVDAAGATVFAGASGVFRSDDAGGIWRPIVRGFVRVRVQDIAVDPTVSTRLYAATSGGVFKSTDAATTWRVMSSGMTNLDVRALVVDPVVPTTLYAGTKRGVFKSKNGGGTWVAASTGLTPCPPSTMTPSSAPPCVMALAIDPLTPSTLYAGTEEGVFKTTDGGLTWAASRTGLPKPVLFGGPQFDRVATLAIDAMTPTTLYAGFRHRNWGVFKSEDGGDTWSPANTGLTGLNVPRVVSAPTAPTTLYAVTVFSGIFKSTDAAHTWNPANVAEPLEAATIAVDPSVSTTLYASVLGSNTDPVKKSRSGGLRWDTLAPGVIDVEVDVVAVASSAPSTVYAGGLGVVFHLAQVSPPDLRVTAMPPLPASAAAGAKVSAGDTTRNIGGTPAPASVTRYYLSSNSKRDNSDFLFTQTRAVPALAPGTQSTGTARLAIPKTTTPGSYFIIACADDTHVIAEARENNNCRASSTTVAIEARPDLVVAMVSNPPASVAPGGTFEVTATLRNGGSDSAGASSTRFYLSLNATKSTSDHRLSGTLSVPLLIVGATYTNTVTVTVPSTVPPGTYFLIACADDTGVLTEISETNNCRASSAGGAVASQVSPPRFVATHVSSH